MTRAPVYDHGDRIPLAQELRLHSHGICSCGRRTFWVSIVDRTRFGRWEKHYVTVDGDAWPKFRTADTVIIVHDTCEGKKPAG
jgi:hypothetical protein